MTEEQKKELQPGDRIRLGENASPWTQGLTFDVVALRTWGVVCSVTIDKPTSTGMGFSAIANAHRYYVAPYRATWDQIEERV